MDEEHKTITKQLEEILNDFCDNYCKYPDIWDEEENGCELMDSEICKNCPLNKI